MKNVLFLLIILCISSLPSYSVNSGNTNKCTTLTEKAQTGYNPDVAIQALECNLRLNKKEMDEQERINLENTMRANIILICANRYEITKNKQYIKKAAKYAFEAIDNNTRDIATIQSAIALAAANLDVDKMIKAYDYLSTVDPKIAANIKNEFLTLRNKVNEKKQQQADLRLQKFILSTQVLQQTTNEIQRNDYLYNRQNTYNVNVNSW